MGITNGSFKVVQDGIGCKIWDCAGQFISKFYNKHALENRANVDICCEALNIKNKTGKTPRQLADENKELIEACKYLLVCIRKRKSINELIMDRLEKAISKAEGK